MSKINLPPKIQQLLINKKFLIGLAILVVLSSALISYFIFARYQKTSVPTTIDETEDLQELDLGDVPEDVTELNILLLGYGGPGHDGPYLTDAIQVLHFNFEKGLVGIVSIPRDLWVKLPNGKQAKINQALTLANDRSSMVMSGSAVAKQMAQMVTGLKIHYFVGVDFVGFKRSIGMVLGGITVDVPELLDDPWYPIRGEELNPCDYSPQEIAQLTQQYSGFELEKHFECRYDHIHFEVGLNHMEGYDALAYIRSRHGSAGGDFSRGKRQQALLKGVRDRLFSLDVVHNIPSFFKEISQQITTDIDLEIIQYLAPALKNAFEYEVREINLSTDNVLTTGQSGGQSIVIPKAGYNQWDAVHELIRNELK